METLSSLKLLQLSETTPAHSKSVKNLMKSPKDWTTENARQQSAGTKTNLCVCRKEKRRTEDGHTGWRETLFTLNLDVKTRSASKPTKELLERLCLTEILVFIEHTISALNSCQSSEHNITKSGESIQYAIQEEHNKNIYCKKPKI